MLFSSITFLFLFLPIVMAVYYIVPGRGKNIVLLIASLFFYAWGEPRYLAIMIITILVNYAGAILLDKHYSSRQRLWIVSLTIVLDLSFLFYFKYFNFVVDNINGVWATDFQLLDVIMPIGISFYTFQAMSYLIDVYRREVPAQKDVYKLALYIVLFPQLVAGPIVKYHDVCEQIDNRTIEFKNVIIGFKRFITGLAKKVLIANTLAEVVDKIFAQAPENLTTGVSWLGAVAYCLQLYYDFFGYSDMAIGLGLMFGFRFLENFNYPYISKSITEFWRRWHISLATWFKLYLYIPLGGNRKGAVRTYWNLFAVFLVTGIWHGAAWSYVAWGIWNGIFIVIERFFGLDKDKNDRWYVSAAKHVYAFFAIVWGMIIFRAESLSYAYEYICRMLHIDVTKHLPDYDYGVNNKFAIMLIVGLICAMPVCRNLIYIKYEHKVQRTLVNIWLFLLFFWSTISLAASTYNPFIYFRF